MATVKHRRFLKRIAIEFAVSLAIGVAIGFTPLAKDMSRSEGLYPRGICNFVVGTGGLLSLNPNEVLDHRAAAGRPTGGLLSLNPNEGGATVYSCNPDWRLVAFYVFAPGIPAAILLFVFIRLWKGHESDEAPVAPGPKLKRLAADLALSFATGLALSFYLSVWTMGSSDWTRPFGVCDVLGQLLLPAPFLAGLAFILIRAIRW